MMISKTVAVIVYTILLGLIVVATAVAEAQALDTTTHVQLVALQHGVDPDLAVSIMLTESSGNPNAIGALGEVGLFQLRPEFHAGAKERNIEVAIRYLSHLKRSCAAYGAAWFLCYNHGPNVRYKHPTKATYYKRVTAIYNERKQQKKSSTKQAYFEVVPYVGQ